MKKIEIEELKSWFILKKWKTNLNFEAFSIFNENLKLYKNNWKLNFFLNKWDKVFKNWSLIFTKK